MKNGVDVGVLIYNELIHNNEVKKMTRGNIHPLVVKKDIPYPYVIYQRTEMETAYCKDRPIQDSVKMQLECVSDSYSECVQLASLLRQCLENMMRKGKLYIRLSDATEEAADNAFIQRLVFTIKINF